jgi:hypothetical protein
MHFRFVWQRTEEGGLVHQPQSVNFLICLTWLQGASHRIRDTQNAPEVCNTVIAESRAMKRWAVEGMVTP